MTRPVSGLSIGMVSIVLVTVGQGEQALAQIVRDGLDRESLPAVWRLLGQLLAAFDRLTMNRGLR